MSETRTLHDPFLNQTVEISSKLTDRLRGKYANGPTMPNGDPEFGWREFPVPPIQKEAADAIERLERLVYVPGQWRCAKCNFRLSQMNLYAATGNVGPRDEAGDKCPNCNGPLWRVSAMDDRNEALKTANEMFDRSMVLHTALRTAVQHIEHMAAWIGKQNAGYSFESLGEDMPGIREAVKAHGAA